MSVFSILAFLGVFEGADLYFLMTIFHVLTGHLYIFG